MTDESGAERIARLTAFASVGTVTTAQELMSTLLNDIEGADANLVAEETLSMVAVATARAIEASLVDGASILSSVLIELPFLYRDYLIGSVMVSEASSDRDTDLDVYGRLSRARSFYEVHFPHGQLPGPRALADKMALWMGRVSPPRLPDMPTDRLQRLQLVPRLAEHTRVVLEYARHDSGID